jgi:arylsulfatase A-like enzyme
MAFKESGYHTSYVGKWHLSGEPHEERWVPPEDRGGFEDFIGWESNHVDHMEGRVWKDDPINPIGMPGHETDARTDIAADRLVSLDERDGNEPFVLFVSYQAPHPPCTPVSPHEKPYEDRDICPEPNCDPEARFEGWGEEYHTPEFRRRYFTEVTQLDAAFGRLLDTLEETGLAEDTVTVFTSDHGEMNGCHGRFGKGLFYEESVRVPLAIRGPGILEGSTIEEPISAIDLFPTLLDVCGISPPRPVPGESFRDCLTEGVRPDPQRPHFFECEDWIGVLRGSEKLLADRDDCTLQAFYDIDTDPWERENQLQDATDSTITTLQSILERWHRRVVSPDEQ